jgi:uncharacterized protein with GYD domain
MAKFVVLARFTDQGVKAVKDTVARSAGNRALAEKLGVKVNEILWTLGPYDVVMLLEADDDRTATAFALSMAARGNVTTTTMRAFDGAEFAAVVDKMG